MRRCSLHGWTRRPWWLVCLACGCELLSDFSPVDPVDGDATDVPTEFGEQRCSDVAEPCPPDMRYVPCGPFLMGAPDAGGAEDEHPEHIVRVSAFCIDRFEVTNRQYAECVHAAACDPPYSPASATRPAYYSDDAFADYPVVHVDWPFARTFCAWRGKRLPSEAEWEKAARGGCELASPTTCGTEDELWYPWGDTGPACSSANFSGCGGDTAVVGTHGAGTSPYGVEDAAGNVAEWTGDWYEVDGYASCATGCTDPRGPTDGASRVIRGGAWSDPADGLRVSKRDARPSSFAGDGVGFRCAAPVP